MVMLRFEHIARTIAWIAKRPRDFPTWFVKLTLNGELTILVHCLYKMWPLDHKRTTSSLVPPMFYVAKNCAIKR